MTPSPEGGGLDQTHDVVFLEVPSRGLGSDEAFRAHPRGRQQPVDLTPELSIPDTRAGDWPGMRARVDTDRTIAGAQEGSMTDFTPHPVVWTREKSSRFWDLLTSTTGGDENYFSAEKGDSIIGFARANGADLGGRVLDFGCGPGHLVRKLLAAGVGAEGADFSPASLDRLREFAGGMTNFGGAHLIESIPTALPSDTFSTVFFIETIEHLLDEDLRATIPELYRIIRPDGHVVVTTPNDENLRSLETICPDCGCAFHSVQHVRSWNVANIVDCMSAAGFETVAAKAWYLDQRWWRSRLITLGVRAIRKRLPHLVYVGRKRSAG